MRKQYRVYSRGDKRIRSGFLVFPKSCPHPTIEKTHIRKWLEYATWEEELGSEWYTTKWIDTETSVSTKLEKSIFPMSSISRKLGELLRLK